MAGTGIKLYLRGGKQVGDQSLQDRIEQLTERVEVILEFEDEDAYIRSRQIKAIIHILAEEQLDYDQVNQQLIKAANDGDDHSSSESTLERRVGRIERSFQKFVEIVTNRPAEMPSNTLEDCKVCKGTGTVINDVPCTYCSGTGDEGDLEVSSEKGRQGKDKRQE
jgi:hypothetical protein